MAKRKVKKRKEPAKAGRLNMIIDPDLKDWAKRYADQHHTTVTALITNHLVKLRESEREINVEQI